MKSFSFRRPSNVAGGRTISVPSSVTSPGISWLGLMVGYLVLLVAAME